MESWTPESRDALENYLKEIERLALEKGDDAGEIVSSLREHIKQEVKSLDIEVVTLEHMRQVLLSVGLPETVIGMDEHAKQPSSTPHRDSPAPIQQAHASSHGPQKFMLMGKGCMFWAIGCAIAIPVCLLTIAILGILATIAIPSSSNSRAVAHEIAEQARITQTLRAVFVAQEEFRARSVSDKDGDGIADYATTQELREFTTSGVFNGLDQDASSEHYNIEMVLTHSAEDGKPHYRCTVKPRLPNGLYLTATATEDRDISFKRYDTENESIESAIPDSPAQ